MNYQEIKDRNNNTVGILRVDDNAYIPISMDNTDYAAYQSWLAEGNTPQVPVVSLDNQKTNKLSELSTIRQAAERNFSFGGAPIDLITETQSRIANAIQGMQLAQTSGVSNPTVQWQVVPGTFAAFDLPTLQSLGLAAYNHVQDCFANAKTLAESISAATDQASLDAINLNSGWPT